MLEQTILIPNATAKQLYVVLLDSSLHSKLINDEAIIDARVGGGFITFSGYSNGMFTKLEDGKLIAHTWRTKDWPKDHYSTVVFELSDTADGAQIHFTQTNLPEYTEDEFMQGWQDNYWKPLEEYFTS
jgi:activator of HSP90 ATPase